MSRLLQSLFVIAVLTTFLVGCNDSDYSFIGDAELEAGFPPGGGGGQGGAGGAAPPAPSGGGSSNISFIVSWTVNGGGQDPHVDPYVVEPSGDVLGISANGLDYTENSPSGGVALHPLDYGFTGQGGPIQIHWPDDPSPVGAYEFGLMWWEGVGSINWTWRVYIGSNVVQTYTGTMVDPVPAGGVGPEGPWVPIGTYP